MRAEEFKRVLSYTKKVRKQMGYIYAEGYIAGAYVHTSITDAQYNTLKRCLE